MKNNLLKIAATVALGIVCLHRLCAQETSPKFNRYTVVPEMYGLTAKQMQAYDKILDFADAELLKMKKQILSKKEKEQKYHELSDVLKTKVSTVFSKEQYEKWCSTHGGYAPSRFYIEDIGMSLRQFTEYRKYTENYRLEKVRLNDETMSATDRDELRKVALERYRADLETIVSEEIADYLISRNLLANDASNVSRNFTILSEYKAEIYAKLRKEYNQAKKELSRSELPSDEKKAARKALDENYTSALRNLMTDEEYIACVTENDKLAERNFINTYRVTKEQYARYIDLQKKNAIDRLLIRQQKISKDEKDAKLKENDAKYLESLQTIFSAEQYAMWQKDRQK